MLGVEDMHIPSVLAGMDGLVAVNSALEVDLFGQCNLELARGRAVSGGGGATDFARGARLARGGISVVATSVRVDRSDSLHMSAACLVNRALPRFRRNSAGGGGLSNGKHSYSMEEFGLTAPMIDSSFHRYIAFLDTAFRDDARTGSQLI